MKIKVMAVVLLFAVVISIAGYLIVSNQAKHNEKKVVEVTSILRYMSETDLIMESDLVVTGRVVEKKQSKWSNPEYFRGDSVRNMLQTDYMIQVESVVKGEAGEQIFVRLDGGEDAVQRVHYRSEAELNLGNEVLLFLARDDSDVATTEDYYIVVGGKTGAYFIDESAAGRSANQEDTAYVNTTAENKEYTISQLVQKIEVAELENPNWDEIKRQEAERTRENNKLLFGE